MFIKLRKCLIIDFVHTESTEGYGCPQADEVGEQQLSKIGQQLKKNIYIHGGHGCPQADFVGERESSEFKQNLNGCPQADGGGDANYS